MNEVIYGIDYLEYYFYWFYYKFIGYPLIIRICMFVVIACIIAYLFLMLHIIYGIYKRKKEKQKYAKAYNRYYPNMTAISLNKSNLTDEEIAEIIGYNDRKRPKHAELRIITQLLTELKIEYEAQINELRENWEFMRMHLMRSHM